MDTIKRVKTLFQLHETPLDAIIIKNGSDHFIDVNFFYATGLSQRLFEGSCLILFPDGTSHIITTELEQMIACSSQATVHVYHSKQELSTILNQLLNSTKTLGINPSGLLYEDYQWITTEIHGKDLVNVGNTIQKARMIKDKDEIQAISKACEIADQVMENIASYIKTNMTENDLAAEIDYHLQRYGAAHPAFETIASFGSNTALPHYTHSDKTLKKGDFVLCDFGASYDKYHSDMTRTFVFEEASEKQKKIHATVLEAQEKAKELLEPDIQAKNIHEQVQSFIDTTEFMGCFIHSTGHSLGLSVHDPGVSLSSTCELPLMEHMVLTIEPGIYIKGFGGVRIEDDIVITDKGYQVLTHTDRLLQIL